MFPNLESIWVVELMDRQKKTEVVPEKIPAVVPHGNIITMVMVITNIIANIRKRNPNTNLMVIPTKTILTLLSLAMTQMTRTTVFEKKREKKMKILKIEKKEPFPPNEINFKKTIIRLCHAH